MSIHVQNHARLEAFRVASCSNLTRRIFIVGASASGKSRLWRVLRSHVDSTVAFPARLVSRPIRADDDPNENQYLRSTEFHKQFLAGGIDFYWSHLPPLDNHHYGFGNCTAQSVVHGANNDFVLNSSSLHSHHDVASGSLVVLVTCSTQTRIARLGARYGNALPPDDEMRYRMMETSDAVRARCDLLINGEADDVSAVAAEFAELTHLKYGDRA
ncbi:MAG: hypothetical protein AB7M05_20810 [Alphaproteobacteria bacterium]